MADIPGEFSLVPSYDEDGNETGYYTREPDGVSGMTVTSLAEFCGSVQSSITQLLDKIRDSDPITNDLSESLQPFAGKDLRLITKDLQGRRIVPDEACQAVAEYYALDAREYAGKSIAVSNYRQIARAGMRIFIWSKTGYVPEYLRPQLKSHTTAYIQRLENMRDHEVPDDAWTTFRESAEVLLLVEKDMRVPVDRLDLCDGSIGSHWSQFRKGKSWAKVTTTYKHVFRDQRKEQYPNAYDLSELSHFRIWLRDRYIPYHLPKYISDKHGKLAAKAIYEEIGGVTVRVLEVTEIRRITPQQEQKFADFQASRQKLLGN